MLVDCHVHVIPPELLDWLQEQAGIIDVRWEQRADGVKVLTVGGRWPFPVKPVFFDFAQFLAAQVAAQVDQSLLSPVPQLFLYEADPAITAEMARVYNAALLEWCQRAPGRFLGLATVPLQDPARAAAEFEWALGQGLRGVIIGPGCAGRLLSDPWFSPMWEVANHHHAIVFLHPLLSADPRLSRPQVPNMVGVPWETTVAAVDLIFGGILDRYPSVRILLAHGGGYLPYQIGRLDHGYAVWPAVRAQLEDRPSAYLRRLWYDTVLWKPEAVTFLLSIVGESRVVPGSDYPFDLSAWPPAVVGEAGIRSLLGSA